jgi:hypothetical protein
MRIILLILIVLLVLLVVYSGLAPKYKFKYYYSKDSTKILTRVSYPNTWIAGNETYLVPGFYDKHELPETYVKPNRTSHGEWSEYITFHSKGILIIGESAETKNLSNDFCYYGNSVTDYSEVRKLDSIESSLRNPEKIALYSFNK